VFVAVAKFKSFSLAGEELRLHQPSVSIAVRGLERGLEVKLFETIGRKVRLTRAGEELLRFAGEILPSLDGVKEKLAEVTGLKKGRIRVGGSALAAATFLPIAVHTFKKQHPGIEVILKIQKSRVLEKKLLDGELDLAIVGRTPRSSHLVSEPYRAEPVVAIAPPHHPLAKKNCVPIELLAKEPLVISESGAAIREAVERTFAEKGLVLKPRLEVDTELGARDAIKNSVAAGIGIGFLSKCHVMDSVRGRRFKILKVPELNEVKRTMYVAVHRNRKSSPHIQLFVDFLRGLNGRSQAGARAADESLALIMHKTTEQGENVPSEANTSFLTSLRLQASRTGD
jgi:DNA-binding transcriptional LysR family regulator